MKEAFEKIKERVCEFIHERNKSGSIPCKNQRASCFQLIRVCDLTAIVNQVAEEFGGDINVSTNIIGELKEFLKERKDYNSEQADIWRGNSYTNAHAREMKDLYMDRANTFGRVLSKIKELEEEYSNDEMITLPKVAFDRMIARMESQGENDWDGESWFINVKDAAHIVFEIVREYQPKGE